MIGSYAPKLTAEGLLDQIATTLSGAEQAFKQRLFYPPLPHLPEPHKKTPTSSR
ncbi:hypothetical protein ACIQYF_21530 [Pseudomonas sp. NPDC096917]|uniref:hypothetical protein n=1 Tax=Pseudomonas sp. NPDC096917 TaxID=3364483 RepID=UPI00383B7FA2